MLILGIISDDFMYFRISASTLFATNRDLGCLLDFIDLSLIDLWEFVDDELHFLHSRENELKLPASGVKDLGLTLTIHAP